MASIGPQVDLQILAIISEAHRGEGTPNRAMLNLRHPD